MNETKQDSGAHGGAVKNTLILVIGEDTTKEEILAMFDRALIFPASHIRVRA